MDPYQKPYLHLFNRVTDALALLEQGNLEPAKELLRQGQIEAEELYIEEAESKPPVEPVV